MKDENYELVKNYFNKKDYLENSDDRILVRKYLVSEVFKDSLGKKILDLGCGDGSVTLDFSNNNKLTLVDISEKMINLAKENTDVKYTQNVEYLNKSIADLNLLNKYDIIICLGILAHVPDPEELFNAISYYSQKNAHVLIETTPNPFPIKKYFFFYYLIKNLFVKNRYDYKKNRMEVLNLKMKMLGLGFTHIQTFKYSFPLPGMRFWPKFIKHRYTLFTLTNSAMSEFGSEHILLFKKTI